MRYTRLEQYAGFDSPIHHIDARVKLVCFILFILAVVLTPPARAAAFFLYTVLVVSIVFLSDVPLGFVLKRSLVILPFAVMIGIFNVFYKPPVVFFNVLIKSWLSALALITLSSTTEFPTLLKALESLRTPKLLTTIISFMYRYIFTLVDQVQKLERARLTRSYGRRGVYQIKAVGNMLGSLFVNTYERGERIYDAMLARGYHGHAHTPHGFKPGLPDVVFTVFFLTSLSVIVLAAAR